MMAAKTLFTTALFMTLLGGAFILANTVSDMVSNGFGWQTLVATALYMGIGAPLAGWISWLTWKRLA